MVHIGAVVTIETKVALTEIARIEGVSRSEIMRTALREFLTRNSPTAYHFKPINYESV